MTNLLIYSCLFALFESLVTSSTPESIVVLPPSFRWGTENEILVTPIGTGKSITVLIKVEIRAVFDGPTQKNPKVFQKNFVTAKTDRPSSIVFKIDRKEHFVREYDVIVEVENNKLFREFVYGTPNIRTIEVQTDKVFYKKGEIVKIRALPLTEDGQLYTETIVFSLWNPHNFKLFNKNASAVDRFIDLEFTLPTNLQYGEWRIDAVPENRVGRIGDDPTMHYMTTFEVQDYVLPLIQVIMSAKVTRDSEAPLFTISARYSHGTLLNGTVRIECRSGPEDTTPNYLSSLTMINGFVSSQVRVSQCFPDKSTTSTTIIAKVRDDSTSATAETRYELDIRVAGFDLVPLKPGFSDRTKNFYVYVKPTGSPYEDLPDVVHLNVTCLANNPYTTQDAAMFETRIGEIIGVEGKWNGFQPCSAIIIFAQREISHSMFSRNVTLMIANMSTALSTNFNLISSTEPTKTTYRVGEEFIASVSRVASEYMVVCNMRDVVVYGQVDQQRVRFRITEKMVPQCVLYVYSISHPSYAATVRDGNQPGASTDMWMFFVENDCPYSATPNKPEIRPSDKLLVELNGPNNGLALLHIVDSRMHGLLQRSFMYTPSTYWEIGWFTTEHTNRLRLMNFLDYANFMETVEKVCKEAGRYFHTSLTDPCPGTGRSSSGLSNMCQKHVMKACEKGPSIIYELRKTTRLEKLGTKASSYPVNSAYFPVSREKSPTVVEDDAVRSAQMFPLWPSRPATFHNPARSQQPLDVPGNNVHLEGEAVNDDPGVAGQVQNQLKIRQHFPEVWLFNDIKLGASGRTSRTIMSPDSIANWSISSMFWGPGHYSVCRPNPTTVISKKDFYMNVELPKHIYINETVTAEIIVTSEQDFAEDYMDLSVCISGIRFKACIDRGNQGELGDKIYNQVRLTKKTRSGIKKTPILFTKPGKIDLVFSLRRQQNVHVHHCKEGIMEDQVKIAVTVEKRADTDVFYKGIIISPDKPLNKESKLHSTEKIDYDQTRSGNIVTTNIHMNPGEAEVQGLALEVSKFLPTAPFNVPKYFHAEKDKLGVIPPKRLFLSDVLKALSVKLYQAEALRIHRQKSIAEVGEIETLDEQIGLLISDMNVFSNCSGDSTPCGFGEYSAPKNDDDVSIPLTAVSTMLLCQHNREPSATQGLISFLFKTVSSLLMDDREIDNILQDLPNRSDRLALLQALLYQVYNDCSENFLSEDHGIKEQSKRLLKDIFVIDNVRSYDPRVIASLAFMSLQSTQDSGRLELNKRIKRNQVPFWDFNSTCTNRDCAELPNDVRQFHSHQDEKRNEVLLNSLGLLAYTNKNLINKSGGNTNLDHLADWIYEQKRNDEGYYSALDTFFASRALFEYRRKHNSTAFYDDPKLRIQYKQGNDLKELEYKLDDDPVLIPLPADISGINITSYGTGKIKIGVQMVATKRQRSRRHTQDDFLPVKITCEQHVVDNMALRQEVCIQVSSRYLKRLQIDHALYTGFKSQPDKFALYKRPKSEAKLVGKVEFSDYGAHLIITGLSPDKPTCYQIGLTSTVGEPNQLAPVLISAKSSDKGLVGQLYISHPDVYEQAKRRRRQQQQLPPVNDAIDKICFDGGQCACTEASCKVQCAICDKINVTRLLEPEDAIGCQVKILETPTRYNQSANADSNYIVINAKLGDAGPVTLWIRACNYRCFGDDNPITYFKKGEWFFLIGNKHGSVVDSQQRRHYLLDNSDYLEWTGEAVCAEANTQTMRANKCSFS